MGEKRSSVYLLVILPDKTFAVTRQVFGEGGYARGRVLRNLAGGRVRPPEAFRAHRDVAVPLVGSRL